MKFPRCLRHLALAVGAITTLGLSACSTTETRAQENPAIIARLAPVDRNLVLAGRVREGLSKEAVFIAWGRPDRVYRGSRNGKVFEAWVFTTREVRYGAGFGAFGPYYPSRVVVGRRGRYYLADYGSFYDPFYARPTYSVEVPVRRVHFENGRVIAFSERNY